MSLIEAMEQALQAVLTCGTYEPPRDRPLRRRDAMTMNEVGQNVDHELSFLDDE